MIQTLFGSLKDAEEPPKKGLFDRMKQAVSRTRESLEERIEGVLTNPPERPQGLRLVLHESLGQLATTDAVRKRIGLSGIRNSRVHQVALSTGQ